MRRPPCKLLVWLALLSAPSVLGYQPLSSDTLRSSLPKPKPADFDITTGSLLSPILIPRVPGTPGSAQVLNHFVDFFRTSLPAWEISLQNSTSTTPIHGDERVPFVNFIARRDPPWSASGNVGHLTLVAHYDSLMRPEGFVGAIDSAAPCAIIMHAAQAIDAALTNKWDSVQTDDFDMDFEDQTGIQVIFLDGEEAFLSWSDEDSIYGARSLAAEWEHTYNPAISIYKTPLDSIELFVLLDLLGSGEYHNIPSWQHGSHWSYVRMATLEETLRNLGLFKSNHDRLWLNEGGKKQTDAFASYVMQDDHLPFMARGVQCLHLIPSRFPSVWHTINDDGEHLDGDVVLDWALLTTAFAAEYLELGGFFSRPHTPRDLDEATGKKTEL
ncbi:hypothetical protein DV737_g4559, partial [Chaetothyriales sp. CBS 132003]